MAEGQGIQWGKMIKGAVKITATVAVIIGVVTAASMGIAAIPGAEGTIGHTVATAGAAVTAGVTGATEAVANAISEPINGIVDMFTGGDPSTGSGENAVEKIEAETKAELDVDDAKARATEAASRGEVVADTSATLNQELMSDIDNTINELTGAAEGEKSVFDGVSEAHTDLTAKLEALQMSGELGVTDQEFKNLKEAIDSLKSATTLSDAETQANQIVAQFNGIDGDGLGHRLDSIISQIDEKIAQAAPDADLTELNEAKAAVVNFGESMNSLHGHVSDIASTVNEGLGGDEIELPNADKVWAGIGAAGVALGAAKASGRAQGQREVMGAFTQAEMDRRSAASRILGQGA